MTPTVSVVVPTCGRPQLLRRCLHALLTQDFDPAAYEIIVVDDCPAAATRRLVHACAAAPPPCPALRYLPNPGPAHGPAAARNRGWRAARGDVIAFTDDDCIPQPDWLCRGLAAFAPHVVGVAGHVEVPLPANHTDYERDAAGIAGIQFLTANCFYRRRALAAVGGFDERFTLAWREDTALFFAMLAHYPDDRFRHAPAAVVLHPIRPAPWGVSLRQQRRSLFNALLYKLHPQRYRDIIQPAPPWRYYHTVAALALAAGAAAARAGWLSAAAALLWLALTIDFCRRRLRHTSHAPAHVAEMLVTSALIPPLSIFWRLAGALKYRVLFL